MAVTDTASHRFGRMRGIAGRGSLLGRLVRVPAAAVSLVFIAVMVLAAVFGPWIVSHPPNTIDIINRFAAPSGDHPLGTDYLGRDTLSRIIFGARTALAIALPAAAGGFGVGVMLGLLAGYVGGLLDKVLLVVMDTLISFPAVILALAILTLTGPSVTALILLIAFALVPGYHRLARGQVFAIKENPYIKAERALGAGRTRILVRHVLPNALPPLVVLVAMDVPTAIGIEAGLAFLGLGVPPPTADWGVMLNDAYLNVRSQPWPMVAPLMTLFAVTVAFTVLGETLRDLTDPRAAPVRRRSRVGRRLRGPVNR